MNRFLTENTATFKLLRTIVQGVLGVVSANIVEMVAHLNLPAYWQGIIVVLVMAILSPIMATLGEKISADNYAQEQDGDADYTEIEEAEEVEDNGIVIEE